MVRPTDGYAGRIKRALTEGPRPMSVRQLADELGGNRQKGIEGRHPDMRGTSYGGVRQYAEGKVRNPRMELLRAISGVLHVRFAWLAFDEGAMTEREEQAQQELGAISAAASSAARAWAIRVLKSAGVKNPRVSLATTRPMPVWVPSLKQVEQRLNLNPQKLGRALAGPLRAVGLDPDRLDLSSGQALASYIVSMIPVLGALAPEVAAQQREED